MRLNKIKIFSIFSIFLLILQGSFCFAEDSKLDKDRRTPFEKYQGAYLGAWLVCAVTQKKVFLIEQAKAKGVELDPDFYKNTDVSACIKNGLEEMKKEYNNILPLVVNESGKTSLENHYVAAIMHVKNTQPRIDEDDNSYMKRMNETKIKTDELWVRFEITQP